MSDPNIGKKWKQQMMLDAQELGAFDFCSKYGKINLQIYDSVQADISRADGGYRYLKKLLTQPYKFVKDSPNTDFTEPRVLSWIELYLGDLEKVQSMEITKLEETEDKDVNQSI